VATRWFLPAVIAMFVLTSLVLVFFGDAASKPTGIAALLLFGVGGGCAVVAELIAPPKPEPYQGEADLPDGTRVPALILPFRELSRALLVLSGLGMTAGCLVFAFAVPITNGYMNSAITHIVMVLAAAFAGLATLFRLISRPASAGSIAFTGPGLIITWPATRASIPWRAIVSVSRRDVFGNPNLKVSVGSPEKVTWAGVGSSWSLVRMFPMLRQVSSIPLRQVALPPNEVVDLANRFLLQARTATPDAGRLGLPDSEVNAPSLGSPPGLS
jgi:hypothetical protein